MNVSEIKAAVNIQHGCSFHLELVLNSTKSVSHCVQLANVVIPCGLTELKVKGTEQQRYTC